MKRNQLLMIAGLTAMVLGVGALAVGAFGMSYTYSRAAEENITTPADANIPNVPVRGPFSMIAQADVIRRHTFSSTDGQVYSEMARTIPQMDEDGNPVLDESGEPVMVPNKARDLWITSTTLQTALQMGALAYGLSAFALLYGLTSIATGMVFLKLRDEKPMAQAV
jgi:hypothetical protein